MKPFYLIVFDFNSKKFEQYDIMETLVNSYKREKNKPTDFAEYVKKLAMYLWWAKCEYEVILTDWPCQKTSEKWDVYKQVMMNFDLIVKIFTENVLDLLNKRETNKKTK